MSKTMNKFSPEVRQLSGRDRLTPLSVADVRVSIVLMDQTRRTH